MILDAMLVKASGGRAEVRLPEAPSTGYRWELRAEPGLVIELENRFEEAAPSERVAGAGGVRVFRLAVPPPLPCRIRFVLKRIWEPEGAREQPVTIVE